MHLLDVSGWTAHHGFKLSTSKRNLLTSSQTASSSDFPSPNTAPRNVSIFHSEEVWLLRPFFPPPARSEVFGSTWRPFSRWLPHLARALAAARGTIPGGRTTPRACSSRTSRAGPPLADLQRDLRAPGNVAGSPAVSMLLQQVDFAEADACDGGDSGADASLSQSQAVARPEGPEPLS